MRSSELGRASLLLCLAACSSSQTPPYTATQPGQGTGTQMQNQYPDGGLIPTDGGTSTCPDSDGTESFQSVVFSEITFGTRPTVELLNNATTTQTLSEYVLNVTGTNEMLPATSILAGDRVDVDANVTSTAGELGILTVSGTIVEYVCWGNQPSGSSLQTQAEMAGLWTGGGACVQSPPTGYSLHLVGHGTALGDWESGTPTVNGCAIGGDL